MIDIKKKYRHAITKEPAKPYLIRNLATVEQYLTKGYKSDDFDMSAYADEVFLLLDVRDLEEALSICEEVE